MKLIDKSLLNSLTHQAQESTRKRKNLNFHDGEHDSIQRMLNAFEPGTYVHPHTHQNPDKREVFVILTGKLLVIFFDKDGDIVKHIVLDRDAGVFAVEIKPGEWHTATGLVEGTVVYEIKDGPYDVSVDKNFATWAPEEKSVEAGELLIEWIGKVGL